MAEGSRVMSNGGAALGGLEGERCSLRPGLPNRRGAAGPGPHTSKLVDSGTYRRSGRGKERG